MRRHYWQAITDVLAESFYETVNGWCERYGKRFTAHLKGEENIFFQIPCGGSCYPHLMRINTPAVDALERYPGNPYYPRIASSLARQFHDGQCLAEALGGSGWGLTPADVEKYIDWLAGCGINRFAFHLWQYDRNSASVRDWPPNIPQGLNWREAMPVLITHMKAKWAAHERAPKVLLVAPVRGCMACFDPREAMVLNEHNGDGVPDTPAGRISRSFSALTEMLHQSGVDFDVTEERLIEQHGVAGEGKLTLGQAAYTTVITGDGCQWEQPDVLSGVHSLQAADLTWRYTGVAGCNQLPLTWNAAMHAHVRLAAPLSGLCIRILDAVESLTGNGMELRGVQQADGWYYAIPDGLLECCEINLHIRPLADGEQCPFAFVEGMFLVKNDLPYTPQNNRQWMAEDCFYLAPMQGEIDCADLISAGFPFCRDGVEVSALRYVDAKGILKLGQPDADAAFVKAGDTAQWVWGENWCVETRLPEGFHPVTLRLIPSTFNTYGPHHYYQGDRHLTSPAQYTGEKTLQMQQRHRTSPICPSGTSCGSASVDRRSTMKVDCKRSMGVLPHMWSKCIGAGRACEGLRAKWQEQLRMAKQECGFEYIRFHGLLAEDMFPCQMVKGKLQYNWYYIDSLYDFLLEIGVRPIVEFGFMPPALASGTQTQFWWKGNVTPPKDYTQWGDLIHALVSHWKERYGLEEIRRWHYEVWNEPNLHCFWGGTKSEYFELYRHAALAVKRVDSQLRVGGPATSNYVPDERFDGEREDVTKHLTHMVDDLDSLEWHAVWMKDFLRFCEKENLPVDFVSCHPYPTDFALDGHGKSRGRSRSKDSLYADMTWLRDTLAQSAYPKAEIHLTEWSSSPSPRDCSHDWLPAADYVVKCNIDCAGLADSLSYWVFTDIFEESGGGPEAFHGGFGLMNEHGVKKPTYHAYRFLNQLGSEVVARLEEGVVTRKEDGTVQALLYNYAKGLKEAVPVHYYPDHDGARRIWEDGEAREEVLTLTGLAPHAAFVLERLAMEDTATYMWEQMGRPANLTREQEAALKACAPRRESLQADENGCLSLALTLAPWEIVFLHQN